MAQLVIGMVVTVILTAFVDSEKLAYMMSSDLDGRSEMFEMDPDVNIGRLRRNVDSEELDVLTQMMNGFPNSVRKRDQSAANSRKKRYTSTFDDPVPPPAGGYGFSNEDIKLIVRVHNERRGLVTPNATNMRKVRWHVGLQNRAQRYAFFCDFRHQVGTGGNLYGFSSIGENLWVGTNWNPSRQPENSVHSFFNEEEYYDYYGNPRCIQSPCGHYTQGVWHWTVEIGCGWAYCDEPIEDTPAQYNIDNILVCHYAPKGNRVGASPYSDGDSCTECPEGYNGGCEAQLCLPDVQCNGLSCENGGTLDPETCVCDCPVGVLGAYCGGELPAIEEALAPPLSTPGGDGASSEGPGASSQGPDESTDVSTEDPCVLDDTRPGCSGAEKMQPYHGVILGAIVVAVICRLCELWGWVG